MHFNKVYELQVKIYEIIVLLFPFSVYFTCCSCVGDICPSMSRGNDSVIRIMKSLVCSGIDSMCVFSTFALELEDK